MKKIIALIAVCLMAASLTGCGTSGGSSAAAATPTPAAYSGTQEATAQGMGEVKVSITFENGVVTACDVDASNETDSIGQVAAPTLAQAIIDGNTPVVDGVSGATMTSNAVIEAATACFTAAGVTY